MQTSFSQQFDTYDDQLPVPSTSPGHPEIPYALNLQLEQYRDKDTYTDGAAFFKKWALGMLVLDNNLKNEGLSTTELCAAADAAAEKYNVSKLREFTFLSRYLVVLMVCDSSYASRETDSRGLFWSTQTEQEEGI